MLNLDEYTKITFGEAFQRNLHHGGAEERVDADGVKRAYHDESQTYWDVHEPYDDPTAQDVIDALRLAIMAQQNDGEVAKLARALVEMAPETDSDRGIQFLIRMIAEGSLTVEMVDHA